MGLALTAVTAPILTILLYVVPQPVSRALTLVMAGPYLYLLWLWTAPHPVEPEWLTRTRWLVRATAILGYGTSLIYLGSYLIFGATPPDSIAIVYGIAMGISTIFILPGISYTAQLARRIGCKGVWKIYRVIFWIGLVSVAASLWQIGNDFTQRVPAWKKLLARAAPHPMPEKPIATAVFLVIIAGLMVLPIVFLLLKMKRRVNGEFSPPALPLQ